MPVTVAVDAMGGDRAPAEIVAGARAAAAGYRPGSGLRGQVAHLPQRAEQENARAAHQARQHDPEGSPDAEAAGQNARHESPGRDPP